MNKVSDLFEVKYGTSLELNSLKQTPDGINFVSRTAKNNGVSAKVELIASIKPLPAGVLTVAGGGSVLETFLQPEPFYSGRDLYYLVPKIQMTDAQKLFYCECIRENKYRYNYGRQANKTLGSILIPSINEIPKWVNDAEVDTFNTAADALVKNKVPNLNSLKWKTFTYAEIFNIQKGFFNKKPPSNQDRNGIPFIGATEKCNGISGWVTEADLSKYSKTGQIDDTTPLSKKLFPGGCITVSNNGSVGEAFYQEVPFTCTHDVNPLYLKDKSITLTPELGLFLATLIRAEKYRWGYGRKWRPIRMPNSIIKLPVTKKGEPDWVYMENYIKTLPYSSSIK